jgi:isocitrate/isopropylmalate dehydrogenase
MRRNDDPCALLPGDGVRHEVVREAVKALQAVSSRFDIPF